jgi:hypothetical protein
MSTTTEPMTTEQALAAATAALEAANSRAEAQDKRIADLEAKAAAAEDGQTPTFQAVHYLHLANGDVVEQAGAIPTHVDIGDENTPQLVPVASAYRKE